MNQERFSPDAESAGALIVEFQPPEEIHACCLRPLGSGFLSSSPKRPNYIPRNVYVEVLAPSTSERICIWRQGLGRR